MEEFRIQRPGHDEWTDWDRLALGTGAAPYLRPGWVRAWVGSFGNAADLRIATVRRNGALVGVLPVLRRGRSLVSPANAETPGVDAVVADDAAAHRLMRGLLEAGCAKVDLVFLPVGARTTSVLRDLESTSAQRFLWHIVRSQPFVDVSGSWAEYESRRLSRKRRSNLRRLDRRLAEMGVVDFRVHRDQERLDALLEEGFSLEAGGWKGRAGTAVLCRRATRTFYSSVARWAAEAGILRLTFLRVSGQPMAFSFGLEQHAVHYAVKIGYNEAYRSLAPGIVLAHRLVEHGFGDPGLVRLDMLGEADRYKMTFASGSVDQVRLRVFEPGAVGSARWMAAEATSSLRRVLREHLSESVRNRSASVLRRLSR